MKSQDVSARGTIKNGGFFSASPGTNGITSPMKSFLQALSSDFFFPCEAHNTFFTLETIRIYQIWTALSLPVNFL